jgi:hypothetical protein
MTAHRSPSKEIAQRIKQLQPKASNRQIAKTLGVGETTVRRDAAPNGAPAGKNLSNVSEAKASTAPNGAPAIADADAAKLIARREQQRRHRQRQREGRRVYPVELDGEVINALINLKWFTDSAAADDREVAAAISRGLIDMARALRKS